MAADDKSNIRRKRVNQSTVEVSSSDVIAVGCKLPHGMHLDFRKPGQPTERFTIKGTNSLQRGAIIVSTIGGYAVTENVPRAFFEKWMKENEHHPAVKNELIFAHREVASVHAIGKELEGDVKSGFDAIDPAKPGRGLQPLNDKD